MVIHFIDLVRLHQPRSSQKNRPYHTSPFNWFVNKQNKVPQCDMYFFFRHSPFVNKTNFKNIKKNMFIIMTIDQNHTSLMLCINHVILYKSKMGLNS